MARAQFQKGQRVWVESVGAWAVIERLQPSWAKGFDEPVRITYDVGLGRDFQASELRLALEKPAETENFGDWRLMRARNRWQPIEECAHHPFPGTYPVIVTDRTDWGGWRTAGAEYDRAPDRIEAQARLIALAPQLMAHAQALVAEVASDPDAASAAVRDVAEHLRETLHRITDELRPPPDAEPT